jgi:hypothetical protein
MVTNFYKLNIQLFFKKKGKFKINFLTCVLLLGYILTCEDCPHINKT